MTKLRQWPDAQHQRLYRLWYNPALTLSEIAAELGVGVKTAKRHAAYLGLRERT